MAPLNAHYAAFNNSMLFNKTRAQYIFA